MQTAHTRPIPPQRLTWPDMMKGISILWIVFFHFFHAYNNGRFPWLLGFGNFSAWLAEQHSGSILGTISAALEGIAAVVFERGSQAVGVFIVLSGFGLAYSLAGSGGRPGGWNSWYRRRLLRLFPIYWLAHLIYLVSPFMDRQDPIDFRFVLSVLGDRFYPAETVFYYLVPAWWFFGLLLQLYLFFPLFSRLLDKAGEVKFLILCGVFTLLSRYLLSEVLEANGNYAQGAFFGARLWEFAFGMVVGRRYFLRTGETERRLFSWRASGAGIVIYILGAYSYQPTFTNIFTDMLIGTGLFIIIAHAAVRMDRWPAAARLLSSVGVYSYSLYLLHQPYAIYFGKLLREFEMPAYIAASCAITAIMTVGTMPLEKYTNRFAGRLFGG
ncbi:acyltransferase family protein [Syntrophobacter fumaroxidans]|uniref:Acyltransferase 3 n=1 Tax=Syntrophobacter fumaroxidans (strain DSM 10017 / MPOB) TaxID=335543 RepID=A0LP70_SYNFM|nr:acyltransferase [Syntrophobacter fumaroxidans]ABK19222.1 acyltransferase 3 [Syntrophobacter fumaroxidans MPOB]